MAAVLFIAAYAVLLNTGEQTVAAGPASFIINTMPVFTALIAMVTLGERFGRWGWIGTAISFGGVGLIAAASPEGFKLDPNALMIVGAALCSAIASVLQKPVLGRMPALSVTAWIMFLGSLPLLPAIPETLVALLEVNRRATQGLPVVGSLYAPRQNNAPAPKESGALVVHRNPLDSDLMLRR